MQQRKNKWKICISILTTFVGIDILLFWQFFFRGQFPFPGNYLLAWFEPWKTQYMVNGTITIAHKAIASDIFRQLYPMKVLGMQLIQHAQLPLWNPYNGSGMPLLATVNIGFLDPLNIFFLFTSPPIAWTISIVLQPILIGIGMYLFVKKLGLRTESALIASFVFLFSGVVITRLIYNMFGLAIASLPFSLYCIESSVQDNKTKIIFFLPIITACCLVSTQPQISLYILLFLVAYVFLRTRLTKQTFLIFIYILLGIGIAAIQLIPTAELFFYANVTKDSSEFIFQKFLLPPQSLISILIPNFFGSDSTYNFFGYTDYIETMNAMGLIAIFLLFVAISHIKNRYKSFIYFFSISIVITFFLTISSPFTHWLYSLPIPLISTGIPTRIYLLTSFSIALLAGFGFEEFQTNHKIWKIALSITSICIAFAILIALFPPATCITFTHKTCTVISLRNTALEVGTFFIFLIGVLFIRTKRYVFIFSALLICGIGLYNAEKFLPYSPKNSFLPTNALIRELQILDGKVLTSPANIQTNFATYFHYYDPEYYHPLYIRRYGELIQYAQTGTTNNLPRSDIQISTDSARLLQLLGITYIVTRENNQWKITKNSAALSRVYVMNNYRVILDGKQELVTLFSQQFDPTKTVILEQNPSFKSSPHQQLVSSIVWNIKQENTLELTTTTNQPALLVILDNYYPGWKAFIDGKTTTLYRANYTFRAISLPQGKHIVKFVYEPFSLVLGIIVSVISLMGVLVFVLIQRFWI